MERRPRVSRREILKTMTAAAAFGAVRPAWTEQYRTANTDWFADSVFGISTHWTAQSQPVRADDWVPFEEAVNQFDAKRYVQQAVDAGARYIIFTGCHALQMLPAPCLAIDQIAPRRTTRRDLIGELADACHARGLHFILYYNHSCNHGDDPAWEYAVGYHAADKTRLSRNLQEIVRELGERYGSRVEGWWFDSCFSLDPRGTYNSVTTDLHGFHFPWDDFVTAAKAGNAERLVALSPGMLTHFLYSKHQDYEAGEANDFVAVPSTRFTRDGLQGHRWVCLDNADWVHARVNTPLAKPRFTAASAEDYVRSCRASRVPVTFNVDIDRTGTFSAESLQFLRELNGRLRS